MTYRMTFVEAAEKGAEDGHAAATWYFDGNTTTETYRAVLAGIEDGDPAVLDTFPYPEAVRDGCLFATDVERYAYDSAFVDALERELTRVARYHLGDETERSHGQGHFVGGLITDESPGGLRFVDNGSENA